jgi:hypothetical protein
VHGGGASRRRPPEAYSAVRLVAVTRMLNEVDIAEAFVRHTAYFVDHQVILDNGSSDGTLDVLRALKQEGIPLTVFQEGSVGFQERDTLTFLYRTAVERLAADWVLSLDADEFIDDRRLNAPLRDYLAEFDKLSGVLSCIKVRLQDYVATPDDPADALVPARLRHRKPISENMKVILKGDLLGRRVTVDAGSHQAFIDGGRECPYYITQNLVYAHFPSRSGYQWLAKAVIGWAKLLAGGPDMVAAGFSTHYQAPFELLKTSPGALLARAQSLDLHTDMAALTLDPIIYRGAALTHTPAVDHQLRAVTLLMRYLEQLATAHGELVRQARYGVQFREIGGEDYRELF